MYTFKNLTTSTKFLSYKEWKIGDYVIGTVKMFRPNAKNPRHQDVVVEVIDHNFKNESLNLKKGDLFTVNGTTALEKVLGAVEEGDILKVTFLGKEEVKTGQWKGTKANKLQVEVAPAQDREQFERKTTESSDDDIL